MRGGVIRQRPGLAGVGGAVGERPRHRVGGDRAAGIEHRHVEQVAVMRVVLGVEDVPEHQRGRLLGLRLEQLLAIVEAIAVGDALHGIVSGAVALDELRVAEEGGGQHRRAGAVGVGLDGDRQALSLRLFDQRAAALDVGLARRIEVADVHVRAGGAGIADQADIGFRRALGVDARHEGDMGEGRHVLGCSQLAHRRQLLHAGTRRIRVEDADADAALVQAAR